MTARGLSPGFGRADRRVLLRGLLKDDRSSQTEILRGTIPWLKNRFSIDGIAFSRQSPPAMGSIGLSFSDDLKDERPRSLTSAVQERLRADILSTRLLPGQKLHIAGLAKQFSVSL